VLFCVVSTGRPTSTANRQRPVSSSGQGASDEIEMTAPERQREIEASLFKVLGQQDDEAGN